MRLSYPYALLVIAALSHVNCQATASDSVQLAPHLDQPDVTALEHSNEYRALRDYSTDADDEERAINFKNLFDVRKWFGLKKSTAAAAAAVKNVEKDFHMQTIANMLNNKQTKDKVFKVWDNAYTLTEVSQQLAKLKKHDKVANLLAEYGRHRLVLNVVKAST